MQNCSSVHLKYLYFWIVYWNNDPESYAGDSIATGMAFPARQVKGDNTHKRDTLVL
jgi:hypothetical protein